MPEKTEELLKGGFYVWRKNLNISVPFLLAMIASIIVSGIFIVLVILLLIIVLFSMFSISDISEIPYNINELTDTEIIALMLLAISLIMFFVVLNMLINSFFHAGAIGMAKTAIETGNTKISDMWDYGKRKFLNLFFANLLVLFIYLVGIFLFLPGILCFFFIDEKILALIFVLFGTLGIVIYLIVASIVLSPVQYAVVVSNTGAIDGVKKGYRFFMDNKPDVFLLWLIISLISIAISIFTGIFQFIAELIPLIGWFFSILISLISTAISVLIIAPLITVWWARLYIDRKRV